MHLKYCLYCKKQFTTRKPEKKFCSRECYFASGITKKKPKTCPACNEQFQPRHTYTTYCSKKCFDKTQTGRPNIKNRSKKERKACHHCKKAFFVNKSTSYRKFCSQKCYGLSKIGKPINVGPSNGQWKGGITPKQEILRRNNKYKGWRQQVFERDNYTCQMCKIRGNNLHAHHLYKFSDFPSLRYRVENGQTLCVDCHNLITKRERGYLILIGFDPDRPPWKN